MGRGMPPPLAAEHKVKTSQSHKVPTTKQSTRNPAPIPLKNAWASLTIQEVVKRPFSGPPSSPQCANVEEPMEESTKQTARDSVPKTSQNRKPEPVKVVSAPQQIPNAWTKPFVPSIISTSYSSQPDKRSFSGPQDKQPRPVSRIQTKQQQNEEQMDDVLETIQIGATSLLRKISTGNTRLVPALKKIMEAAMDAINTLTV